MTNQKRIIVNEDRELIASNLDGCLLNNNLGTVGEHNATELVFELPESLRRYGAELVCETSNGSFVFAVENGRFTLPRELLTDSTLNVQLVLRDGAEVVWKSIPCVFTLNPSLDASGQNFAEQFRDEGREERRAELANALNELTGDDVSSDSWDELTYAVTALPLETEEKINARADYSMLTYAFEKATTPPNILSGTAKYNYDTVDDTPQYIKLPYIYTPNVDWSRTTKINNNIVECGFDVSGSTAKAVTTTPSSFLQGAAKLKKIKLTGLGNLTTVCYLFYDNPSIEEAELYFDGTVEGVLDKYWMGLCYGASNLRALYGDPLDMSKGTDTTSMFKNTENLRYIRFVPNSIGTDIDMSSCTMLHHDTGTLLSILNGVRGGADITLRFAATVKPYLSSLHCRLGDDGLYELSDNDTDPTIQSVMIAKGVTIS